MPPAQVDNLTAVPLSVFLSTKENLPAASSILIPNQFKKPRVTYRLLTADLQLTIKSKLFK
jgi:hypothetical protein